MKKGGQDVKAIYFNVYKQDNVRPQDKPTQDRVYGTKDTYKSPYSNTDMLDDHLE